MNRLLRDFGFLIISTVLMAIIAYSSVNNLRVVREEIRENRIRTQAANACQIEALQLPVQHRTEAEWVQNYLDCVDRRSTSK